MMDAAVVSVSGPDPQIVVSIVDEVLDRMGQVNVDITQITVVVRLVVCVCVPH